MNTEQIREDDDSQCLLDSGASQHMTANKQLLTNYQGFDVPETVILGDGHTLAAYGSGRVIIALTRNKSKDIPTTLDKVLCSKVGFQPI